MGVFQKPVSGSGIPRLRANKKGFESRKGSQGCPSWALQVIFNHLDELLNLFRRQFPVFSEDDFS